jgi:hypothetical protein
MDDDKPRRKIPRISPTSRAPRAAAAGRPTFHPPPLRTTTRRWVTPTSIPTRKRDSGQEIELAGAVCGLHA